MGVAVGLRMTVGEGEEEEGEEEGEEVSVGEEGGGMEKGLLEGGREGGEGVGEGSGGEEEGPATGGSGEGPVVVELEVVVGEGGGSREVLVHDNLSENPETGQSEVLAESQAQPKIPETSPSQLTGDVESSVAELVAVEDTSSTPASVPPTSVPPTSEPVPATSEPPTSVPAIQLQDVSEVLQVSVYLQLPLFSCIGLSPFSCTW